MAAHSRNTRTPPPQATRVWLASGAEYIAHSRGPPVAVRALTHATRARSSGEFPLWVEVVACAGIDQVLGEAEPDWSAAPKGSRAMRQNAVRKLHVCD